MAEGWICSRCKASVAPTERTCPACSPVGSYTTLPPYKYTWNPPILPTTTIGPVMTTAWQPNASSTAVINADDAAAAMRAAGIMFIN